MSSWTWAQQNSDCIFTSPSQEMLYTRVRVKPFSGGAALGRSQVEAVTSEVECKLCVPETRSEVLSLVVAGCSKHCSWGLLPSVMFLPTNKSWFGSFGSVWSRHKLFLVLFLLLEFHLSERASTLLDQADSKSKLFSYICVTETPPARDMTILYKYIQSIVQAILVPFYPLSFFSSFITDTLAKLFCLHLCCFPFLCLWPHFNYLFWKEPHPCVLSAVENFKVIF